MVKVRLVMPVVVYMPDGDVVHGHVHKDIEMPQAPTMNISIEVSSAFLYIQMVVYSVEKERYIAKEGKPQNWDWPDLKKFMAKCGFTSNDRRLRGDK